jgi:hypothetical protein
MQWYTTWVRENVILSSFIQFFILGTLGELVGMAVSRKTVSKNVLEWFLKAIVWGLLGIVIKYAFRGYVGFVNALVDHHMLPAVFGPDPSTLVLRAFALSFFMNAQFGPLLMFLHRTTDNLITRSKGYSGIDKSLWTLLWFWLPAHTLTFSLPGDYQIGVAALLSVALGIIMGYTKRKV